MTNNYMTLERATQIGNRPLHYSEANRIEAWSYLDGYADKYGYSGRSHYLELAQALEAAITHWPVP